MLATPPARRRRLWTFIVLVCFAAPAAVAAVRAAAPPPAAAAPAAPLFVPEKIFGDPSHLAPAMIGQALAPGTGGLNALSVLKAGEFTEAWSLDGPMTTRFSRVSLAAATLAAAYPAGGSPLSSAVFLKFGEYLDCWKIVDVNVFRDVPVEWLQVINDGKATPVGGDEATVYSWFLERAHYTSRQAFATAVRPELTYNHLIDEPNKYRGRVVRASGRLLRINRYDPPREAAEAGVSDLYEAYIFNEEFGANPYAVIFTTWTPGLKKEWLGKGRIDEKVRVSVDGYFFKKFRYASRDRNRTERETPQLIANSLDYRSTDKLTSEVPPWIGNLLTTLLSLLGVIVVVAVGLLIWFRRGDRDLRKRLQARMPEFVLPPPDVVPQATPVALPVKPARPVYPPPMPRITFPSQGGDRGGSPGDAKSDEPPRPEDAGA